MTAPRSRTGKQLATAAELAGWTVHVTPGTGTTRIPDPHRPTLGDGTRPNRYIDTPCQSEAIRLHHPDGRRAIAVLISLDGKSWTADDTWTWTANTTDVQPRRTTVRQLLAHLTPERTETP